MYSQVPHFESMYKYMKFILVVLMHGSVNENTLLVSVLIQKRGRPGPVGREKECHWLRYRSDCMIDQQMRGDERERQISDPNCKRIVEYPSSLFLINHKRKMLIPSIVLGNYCPTEFAELPLKS